MTDTKPVPTVSDLADAYAGVQDAWKGLMERRKALHPDHVDVECPVANPLSVPTIADAGYQARAAAGLGDIRQLTGRELIQSLEAADKHVHELLAENAKLREGLDIFAGKMNANVDVAQKYARGLHHMQQAVIAINKLPSDERVRALRKLATSLARDDSIAPL